MAESISSKIHQPEVKKVEFSLWGNVDFQQDIEVSRSPWNVRVWIGFMIPNMAEPISSKIHQPEVKKVEFSLWGNVDFQQDIEVSRCPWNVRVWIGFMIKYGQANQFKDSPTWRISRYYSRDFPNSPGFININHHRIKWWWEMGIWGRASAPGLDLLFSVEIFAKWFWWCGRLKKEMMFIEILNFKAWYSKADRSQLCQLQR